MIPESLKSEQKANWSSISKQLTGKGAEAQQKSIKTNFRLGYDSPDKAIP
jgi:hypothetical protein